MTAAELEADLLIRIEGGEPIQVATVRFPVVVGTDGVVRCRLAEYLVPAMRAVAEAAEETNRAGERR
jgi:hypothetical protein